MTAKYKFWIAQVLYHIHKLQHHVYLIDNIHPLCSKLYQFVKENNKKILILRKKRKMFIFLLQILSSKKKLLYHFWKLLLEMRIICSYTSESILFIVFFNRFNTKWNSYYILNVFKESENNSKINGNNLSVRIILWLRIWVCKNMYDVCIT